MPVIKKQFSKVSGLVHVLYKGTIKSTFQEKTIKSTFQHVYPRISLNLMASPSVPRETRKQMSEPSGIGHLFSRGKKLHGIQLCPPWKKEETKSEPSGVGHLLHKRAIKFLFRKTSTSTLLVTSFYSRHCQGQKGIRSTIKKKKVLCLASPSTALTVQDRKAYGAPSAGLSAAEHWCHSISLSCSGSRATFVMTPIHV